MALAACGGKYGGLTMTVSTMQLGVCSLYAILLWIITINPIKLCGLQLPDRMKYPKLLSSDYVATLPVGFCSACAAMSSRRQLGEEK